MKKNKHLVNLSLFFAIVMVIGVFFSCIPVHADLTSVRDSSASVMRFNLLFDGEAYGRGSCFLINETTILTANHCVKLSEEEYSALYNMGYATRAEIDARMSYSVTLSRDLTIEATVINQSENMDFAILRLSQPLSSRKAIALRSSGDVKAAETVYSVGYPVNKDTTGTYNADDVVFEQGIVNRTQFTSSIELLSDSLFFEGKVPYHVNAELLLVSGGTFSSGNSGGPMIDEDGFAIGICVGSNEGNCCAIAIDQVKSALDDLAIGYTKSNEPVSPPASDKGALQTLVDNCENLNKSNYTEETWDDLAEALADAKRVLNNNSATETEITNSIQAINTAKNALERKSEPQTSVAPVSSPEKEEDTSDKDMLIIILVAVVIIIIIVAIIVIAVVSGKKKTDRAIPGSTPGSAYPPQNQYMGQQPPVTQQQPPAVPQQPPVAPQPTVTPQQPTVAPKQPTPTNQCAGETTVLSSGGSGAGETTVLSQGSEIPKAYLVRMKNGDKTEITKSEFRIGKESSSVDYCISGNSSISRFHAIIKYKSGKFFILDNKTTNHTYVNGSIIPSNFEQELSNGDVITLSDEKFEFKTN